MEYATPLVPLTPAYLGKLFDGLRYLGRACGEAFCQQLSVWKTCSLKQTVKKIATPNASAVHWILMFVFLVRSPWLAPTGGDLREKGPCG